MSLINRRNFLSGALAAAATPLFGQLGGMASRSIQPQARRSASHRPFSRFTDVAFAAGLTHPMFYGEEDRITYIYESMGGGCAFFDYDNDGWMDVFILGGSRLAGVPADVSNRLYHNNKDGTFTDVTQDAGLYDAGWACGVCVGDYNNDGYEDLFCTCYGHNKLYRNNGDGTFTDVTRESGLWDERVRFSTGCSFLDYNRDGHLDIFVANYVQFDKKHPPLPSASNLNCSFEGVPVYCGPRGLVPGFHSLYRNNGDGTFTDVSEKAGISAVNQSYGLTAVSADFDNDGWPDIFVACDSTPSLLFMNNRDGTFREEGLIRGVAVSGDGSEQAGMGVGVGDVYLDGNLDLFVTHFQGESGGLYRNIGKGQFNDVSSTARLSVETRYVSWGAGIVDLDNDGFPDIFAVTGNVYPEIEKRYPQYPFKGPRTLFRNLGDGTFEELLDGAGPGISEKFVSRGCAFGDFDNDGDLDILIMNMNAPPSLLRNDAPPGNHWIKVKLIGTKSNRSGIGARVVVHYGGRVQAQQLLSQSSYLSSNDPRLHFGLGAATRADVEIFWPSGMRESARNLAVDREIGFREGATGDFLKS